MTPPLTRAFKTLVHQLERPRTRRESGLFKAEGDKCVADTLGRFPLHALLATDGRPDAIAVTAADMARMSSLQSPPDVIAVYRIPPAAAPDDSAPGLILALDDLQDPGNLGTIIRLAAWFAISQIWCSANTADCYSPKVVQATMGALAAVKLCYGPLDEWLRKTRRPVLGTFLGGEDIFVAAPAQDPVLVIGNEGHGISEAVAGLCTRRLTIPRRAPAGTPGTESLNAATATAIALAALTR